jgi:hypothetical protein
MLGSKGNPNGRPNSDVVKPWINAEDLTGRPRNMGIVDFGPYMTVEEAAKYVAPFKHVKEQVFPERQKVKRKHHRERWWIHEEPRPGMRKALEPLARFVATPRVSKHRVFVWVDSGVLPDSALVVLAREDDYFLGVLQSRLHEVWARATGTQLREAESGFRYSQSMTFETFPFPWPLGGEKGDAPPVVAIAKAARDLCEMRDRWLQSADAHGAHFTTRTLTDLYNEFPDWLRNAHNALDEAVMVAYGLERDLSDEAILERLLAMNVARSKPHK